MKRKPTRLVQFTPPDKVYSIIIEVNHDGTIPSMPFWDGRNSWVASCKDAQQYDCIKIREEMHHIRRMREQKEG